MYIKNGSLYKTKVQLKTTYRHCDSSLFGLRVEDTPYYMYGSKKYIINFHAKHAFFFSYTKLTETNKHSQLV
jgi:hypothetical protein